MPATLKLTHQAIGAEVRRGTYDVVVDGERDRVGRNEPHDRGTSRAWTSHPASSQWTKLEQHANLRRRRGRDRRLPMHRKEVLADLSRILCRAQAGPETRSRLSRRRRRGATSTSLSPPGCRSRPGTRRWPEGARPLPASPGATGSTTKYALTTSGSLEEKTRRPTPGNRNARPRSAPWPSRFSRTSAMSAGERAGPDGLPRYFQTRT